MRRFENAQIGDKVYCRLHGDGIIYDFSDINHNILNIHFPMLEIYKEYYAHGVLQLHHFEPTLFYRKGSEKYLTERPEPEIDWEKIPIGTKVYCTDRINEKAEEIDYFVFYNPKHNFPFWILVEEDKAAGYKYCKLAEPCKLEWIKK